MKQGHKVSMIFLIFILLTASVILNYFLFVQGKWYIEQLNLTRLDPLGLRNYPIENSTDKKKDTTRVVFFGDSRAAGWSMPEQDGYEFLNRGIDSQTSMQVLQRFNFHIQPLDPEILILQVGINDLKTISLFPTEKETIISNLKQNIEMIVKKSISKNSAVILVTIFPHGEKSLWRSLFFSDEFQPAIHEMNLFLSSLADEKVVIFDAYKILVGENGLTRSNFSKDLLHINEAGYKSLNLELLKMVNKLNSRIKD